MSIYADSYIKTYDELDTSTKQEAIDFLANDSRFKDYYEDWCSEEYTIEKEMIEHDFSDFASVSRFSWEFSSQGPYLDMYRHPVYTLKNTPKLDVTYNGKKYTVKIEPQIEFSYEIKPGDLEIVISTVDDNGDKIEYNSMFAFNSDEEELLIEHICNIPEVHSMIESVVSKLQEFFYALWENVRRYCLYDYASIEDVASTYAEDGIIEFVVEFDEETETETVIDFEFN